MMKWQKGKILLLLLFYYSRQAARRECNAKAPEDEDDDGEVFGVDDDEGGIGRYLMGEKKKGQHPSQLQQGNRKKNMKIN